MKKLLALLALALLAFPAHAGDVVVVPYYSATAATYQGSQLQARLVQRFFRKQGVTCDVMTHHAVRASLLKDGLVNISSTASKQYDLVVITGFIANGDLHSGTAGFFVAESLTRVAKFNTVPIIFVGYPSSNMFTQSGSNWACSTGVAANALENADGDSITSAYLVGSTERWKTDNQLPLRAAASKPPGIWRVLVGYSQGGNAGEQISFNPHALLTRSDNPDTFLVAMRDMSTAGGQYVTAKPQFYVSIGQSPITSSGYGAFSAFAIAAAKADSFMNGAIFDNHEVTPSKVAFVIRSAFRTGAGDRLGFESSTGIQAARNQDSTSIKYMCDSLRTLDEKFTVTYEPDSLQYLPYQRLWYDRLGKVKYIPYVTMGAASPLPSTAGLASPTTPRDPFGKLRTRIAWGGGTGTGADTGSVWSNVRWAKQLGVNFFGAGNVDAAIMPADDDMKPSNWTTIADTMLAAIADAGYSAIITNTDNIAYGNAPFYEPRKVRVGLARPSNWYSPDIVAPRDTVSGASMTATNTGRTINFLPTTAYSTIGAENSVYVAHGYATDCLMSLLLGIRALVYPAAAGGGLPNGINETTCYVCAIQTANIGYSSDLGARAAHGYRFFTDAINQMHAINKAAGRTLVTSAWPSEINPVQP